MTPGAALTGVMRRAEIYGSSIRGRLALGPGRGQRVMVLRRNPDLSTPRDLAVAGPRGHTFDVHAAVNVCRTDRKGRERLCRYLSDAGVGRTRPRAAA